MVDSVYIVKSTPLRAFIGSFQHFEDMLQTYWRCAWRSLMQKKIFWQTYRVFNLAIFRWLHMSSKLWLIVHTFCSHFFNTEDMLQTYWRCAWRGLMQKKYLLTNSMQGVSSKSYTYCQVSLSHRMTKPTKCVCAQRRLRSAWASAQSNRVFTVHSISS